MKIINHLRLTQPEIIPILERMGFNNFKEIIDEEDPEFNYINKLIREVPRKYREG